MFKKRFDSDRFRRDISELEQLQRLKKKLAPIKAGAPEIARIIMKEQNRGGIKYQRLQTRPLDGLDLPEAPEVDGARQIPEEELDACLSTKHKEVLRRLKGEQVPVAFSNYARFKQPTKYQQEVAAFYRASTFAAADLQVLKAPRDFPGFGRQLPRTDMFLRPEIMKAVEAERQAQQAQQQRLQQLYGELELGEGDELTWAIRFSYEAHKNVKDLRKMVSTLIGCVKESTHAARLGHSEDKG